MSNNPYELPPNPIMKVDSYKWSHPPVYPKNVTGMFSYGEPRIKGEVMVPAGAQMWVMKNLMTPVTQDNVLEAEDFAKRHGEPFFRYAYDKLVGDYGGYIPGKMRIVPEGTRVPSQNILYSFECTDPDLFWIASNLETNMQRGIWYPTTIASNDYKNWRAIRRYALESCDDLNLVPFQLHDFGGRGVSSGETAEVGGFAHLIYFMGSDTVEGIRAANWYYNPERKDVMSAFSVPASEHTVQCSFGSLPWEQKRYLESMLSNFAKKGAIVSIVIDGYDTFRETQQICDMRDAIVASGAKVVLRPDSGDPMEILPKMIKMLEAAFGTTVNGKGYKVLNNVGLLQGDGINYDSMVDIMDLITKQGYASSNLVFGSGGALLQKVNRDTYKFAQKASAILVDGQWKGIAKDPVTDPGKKSKAGRLSLFRSRLTGEYSTFDMDSKIDSEFEDVMVTLYEDGKLYNLSTLDEIRARAQA